MNSTDAGALRSGDRVSWTERHVTTTKTIELARKEGVVVSVELPGVVVKLGNGKKQTVSHLSLVRGSAGL